MRAFAQALAALVVLPAIGDAQTWRTVDVSRQLRDSTALMVHVEFGAGRFDLRPADEPVLYAMHLRYDEGRAKLVDRFDPDAHTLTIGVSDHSTRWAGHKSEEDAQEMRLVLARTVPMDLSLTLGATQTTVDLGGLSLRGLKVETGAAEARLEFSTPNRVPMNTLVVEAGAASFTMRDIANARASTVQVHSGVGAVDLGFGGIWTGDVDATVAMAIGKVTIHVPRDVGIRLDMQRFLASFDGNGLDKRGGAFYSENWESAKYHLRLHVDATFGAVEVDRAGAGGQD